MKRALLLLLILPLTAASQSPNSKPAFEVISVKSNTTGRNASIAQQPGGRFVASEITLRRLILYAYRGHQQFIGGPAWLDTDRWDIEARAAEGTVLPRAGQLDMAAPDTLALMVQSLLEDRFKLKAHTDTRELPLYELVIAKGGPKVKLSEDQTPPSSLVGGGGGRGAIVPRGGIRIGNSDFEASAQSISVLAAAISTLFAERSVIDKTGLKGLYDIRLQWDRDSGLNANAVPNGIATAPSAGPSLPAALEEQLGLRLQSAKGPLPVLVIDSVERPSDN